MNDDIQCSDARFYTFDIHTYHWKIQNNVHTQNIGHSTNKWRMNPLTLIKIVVTKCCPRFVSVLNLSGCYNELIMLNLWWWWWLKNKTWQTMHVARSWVVYLQPVSLWYELWTDRDPKSATKGYHWSISVAKYIVLLITLIFMSVIIKCISPVQSTTTCN